jgi:hypothetical protein
MPPGRWPVAPVVPVAPVAERTRAQPNATGGGAATGGAPKSGPRPLCTGAEPHRAWSFEPYVRTGAAPRRAGLLEPNRSPALLRRRVTRRRTARGYSAGRCPSRGLPNGRTLLPRPGAGKTAAAAPRRGRAKRWRCARRPPAGGLYEPHRKAARSLCCSHDARMNASHYILVLMRLFCARRPAGSRRTWAHSVRRATAGAQPRQRRGRWQNVLPGARRETGA